MKQFTISRITTLLLLVIALLSQSCRKTYIPGQESTTDVSSSASERPDGPGFVANDVVMYWNYRTAQVLGVPMRQPDRTRYFAIIEIAVHDALNNIKPKYQSYILDETTQFANPDAAVASAAYWAIKDLNLQNDFPIDQWYDSCLAAIPDGGSKERGETLGQHAAESIVANRANDGFSQVIPASPNPPDGTAPGAYRQTNTWFGLRPIPNWGTVVKPFVTTSNYQFRPGGPYPVTSPNYAGDYNEVKEKGGRTNSTRTAEEEILAKFWSDNRPSIMWNDFARGAIATQKLDAWKTARLFALMHTAIADGLNTVLESKYYFYYWRPETAIHEGANDGNDATTADPSWEPFIDEAPGVWVSPPVPEYPSSYSMTGGAAAAILKSFFKTDLTSVDMTSALLPGTIIHYSSLAQAARDNSLAKVYAGWYFRKAALDGEEVGRQIAAYVFNHSFKESGE